MLKAASSDPEQRTAQTPRPLRASQRVPAVGAKGRPSAVWAITITTGTLVDIGCERPVTG
jgi:hypothetical protein